jgi:hypothetical protein
VKGIMDQFFKPGEFYLGKVFDPKEGKLAENPVFYEADDLTTHAVVVGMTGSGKTGLCVGMLEEAALNNLPALMIDPKGDLTNLLLHFPDLRPEDFGPWINPDLARRSGENVETVAAQEAENWRKGLESWGIGRERILALKKSAQFAVFTPGSDSGLPVSILASLEAPTIPWEENREILRERISATVTALLGLVGIQDIDPVRSREHILLSNIFENAWKVGKDLDLGELILQTQNPPFQKLGVFDVNTFYPEKDRFALAMSLNNILASPSFQAWIEGQPLDIPSLLYTPDGKPRHSVFYIAHLQESERMFFVTLLFSALETWMRSQPGTPSLRSLVYFDEIYGYLPPIKNPPSKPVMLRMLKQARAFGIGLVLATQNPADVDYKGISNTGTWLIGKLQTDQDKQRLLDGLEGAMPGGFNRGEFDRVISGLGKRVFLLHNVHDKAPRLFQTRWVMNYLAGPLTRSQIPALNLLAGVKGSQAGAVQPVMEAQQPEAVERQRSGSLSTAAGTAPFSTTRPPVGGNAEEYFLLNNLTFAEAFKEAGLPIPSQAQKLGLIYRPAVFARQSVQFQNRKYNLDYELVQTVLAPNLERRGMVRWEQHLAGPIKDRELESQPDPQGRFAMLESPLNDAKWITAARKDFLEWAYRTSQVTVRANERLAVFAGPDVPADEFKKMCEQAAQDLRRVDEKKLEENYKKKIVLLEKKIQAEERELAGDQAELEQRKIEEWGTHAENLLSLFGGRKRRVTTSLSKRRMTARAKADLEESRKVIAELQKQVAALQAEQAAAMQELQDRFNQAAAETTEITVKPFKKDIHVEKFGIAWFPFYLARTGEEEIELPGFSAT